MRCFKLFSLFTILLTLVCVSCQTKEKGEVRVTSPEVATQKIKDQFVVANQLILQKESDEMDAYERSHQLRFVKTTSGVRYHVYKPSASGDSIRKGMPVSLNYTVYLLDGSLCYSSDVDGTKHFIVEQEQIESGIHRGLQYLKKGDKALLLIPSHLAHGLLGDFKKIPPQMPIIYNVEVF
ncbi:MAG: FKBP-type peptidyl-prolyl cis-trans isomerase [Bacteroidia bacterium]|nr:FKBP-type peptidyl-prolyl cis-trans isomerase [Bacteroidia bacterium]